MVLHEGWLRACCDLVVHRRLVVKLPTDLQLACAECRVFIEEQTTIQAVIKDDRGNVPVKDESDVESLQR
jgi:hypothetical protein